MGFGFRDLGFRNLGFRDNPWILISSASLVDLLRL